MQQWCKDAVYDLKNIREKSLLMGKVIKSTVKFRLWSQCIKDTFSVQKEKKDQGETWTLKVEKSFKTKKGA